MSSELYSPAERARKTTSNATPRMRDVTFTINATAFAPNAMSPWAVDGFWKSCISCDHFDEKQELCKKWGARPPARVIAFACESYTDDNAIPF